MPGSENTGGGSASDVRDADERAISNRRALADFLRSRRERVAPADVGLSGGSRRRTGGLRREEVAFLTGISVTWYVYLEQARDVQPSRELLNSLARVLQLNEDERRYIHMLSYGSVPGVTSLAADSSLVSTMRKVVGLSMDSPYPVYAGDHCCYLVAWNRAACEWYQDWSVPGADHNLLRWLMTDPTARDRFVDWEAEVEDLVARWRSEFARHPDDARMPALRAELAQLNPDFDKWWESHQVLEHRSGLRRFRHPRLGSQTFRIMPFTSVEFPSIVVVLHLPVYDDTPNGPVMDVLGGLAESGFSQP